MRVNSNASIYDDEDDRCQIKIQATTSRTGQVSYLVLVSYFDKSIGAINWYYGTTELHFHDYPEEIKLKIIKTIMESGGDVFKLRDMLNSSFEYFERFDQ